MAQTNASNSVYNGDKLLRKLLAPIYNPFALNDVMIKPSQTCPMKCYFPGIINLTPFHPFSWVGASLSLYTKGYLCLVVWP